MDDELYDLYGLINEYNNYDEVNDVDKEGLFQYIDNNIKSMEEEKTTIERCIFINTLLCKTDLLENSYYSANDYFNTFYMQDNAILVGAFDIIDSFIEYLNIIKENCDKEYLGELFRLASFTVLHHNQNMFYIEEVRKGLEFQGENIVYYSPHAIDTYKEYKLFIKEYFKD